MNYRRSCMTGTLFCRVIDYLVYIHLFGKPENDVPVLRENGRRGRPERR